MSRAAFYGTCRFCGCKFDRHESGDWDLCSEPKCWDRAVAESQERAKEPQRACGAADLRTKG